MNEIVKNCSAHGDLKEEEIYRHGNRIRCRKCRIENVKKNYHLNRENKIEYVKKWKRKNRDKINARQRELRSLNIEKYREYERLKRAKDPFRRTSIELARRYQITLEQYNEIITKNNNLCCICGEPEKRKSPKSDDKCRMTMDHCHKCEKNGFIGLNGIRGILCHECNTGLGKFKDNIELLKKAIEYLKKHDCK